MVTLDGRPARLLRANFIVRGVSLDKASDHRVGFSFEPSRTGLYISLASVAVALGLLSYLGFGNRKSEVESATKTYKKRKETGSTAPNAEPE